MGLDRPFFVQYVDYVKNMFTGNFGRSYQTHRLVIDELKVYIPKTLQLALIAELISSVIGILLGLTAAVWNGRFLDRLITVLSAFQLSFPLFWLALMLQLIFSVYLKILPPSGYQNGFDQYILLPAMTLAIPSAGMLSRLTRVTVLEVLREDFIRTIRAKGAKEMYIYFKHALPNAMIPIITTIGLDFARLVGGITMIEVIFSWPGLGKYAFDALVFKDMPALQASVLLFALFVSLINLGVDVLYGVIDPRISRS
jgi:peptide/nickel transport system permease protein